MAENPIKTPLPADLPEDWVYGQTVGPNGTDAGLTEQHGYNYLMQQVNTAQEGVNTIAEAFQLLATLTNDGVLSPDEIPNIDCGIWDSDPIAAHNAAAAAHQNLTVDGNNTAAVDNSQTLEEHMANPNAHQNLIVDGNNT